MSTYYAEADRDAYEIPTSALNDYTLFIAIATVLRRLLGANKNASLIMREAVWVSATRGDHGYLEHHSPIFVVLTGLEPVTSPM